MLTGKTALITGSTSGIGKGIAQKLATLGAQVTINGFADQAEIDAQLTELTQASGQTAKYANADMSKPTEIRDMIETRGPFDILVNNAGIQHVSPVDEFPPEKWDAIIAINLSSNFHTIAAALPAMRENGWGRVINIASAHSLVASPFKSAYIAAKHGVIGLTKSTALECATDGVTVNAISPGYVLTPLVEKQIPDTAKARGISEEDVIKNVMLAPQPIKQFVQVDQVAEMVAYLCSDAASAVTGTNLSIDGGWTAQ